MAATCILLKKCLLAFHQQVGGDWKSDLMSLKVMNSCGAWVRPQSLFFKHIVVLMMKGHM